MAISRTDSQPEPAHVLGKAVLRAADRMGLSRAELGRALGRDRSSLTRAGVDPDSKAGELAALLIRSYRSLAVMVDDNESQMREWLGSPNRHTGGVPREQLQTVDGLVNICSYLDAIRAKV